MLRGEVREGAGLQVILPLLPHEVLLDAREVSLVPLLHVAVEGGPVLLLPLPRRPLVPDGLDLAQGSQEEGRVRRVHRSPGLQVLVPRNEDAVEHALAQQEVAHPLADYHVDLARQHHRLDRALQHADDVGEAVGFHDSPTSLGHVRCLDGEDLLRTSSSGHDGQDTCPRTHVQDHLALEAPRVPHDAIEVGACPVGVLQHVHLVVKVGILAKIVCVVRLVRRLPVELVAALRV
mmetsp:Transcript_28656/g.77676  ORF Transcript_28656/g.77676 Transcript_28656/m.77676 type:complete len:234 (+) Transcript_28656:526-1227(+)